MLELPYGQGARFYLSSLYSGNKARDKATLRMIELYSELSKHAEDEQEVQNYINTHIEEMKELGLLTEEEDGLYLHWGGGKIKVAEKDGNIEKYLKAEYEKYGKDISNRGRIPLSFKEWFRKYKLKFSTIDASLQAKIDMTDIGAGRALAPPSEISSPILPVDKIKVMTKGDNYEIYKAENAFYFIRLGNKDIILLYLPPNSIKKNGEDCRDEFVKMLAEKIKAINPETPQEAAYLVQKAAKEIIDKEGLQLDPLLLRQIQLFYFSERFKVPEPYLHIKEIEFVAHTFFIKSEKVGGEVKTYALTSEGKKTIRKFYSSIYSALVAIENASGDLSSKFDEEFRRAWEERGFGGERGNIERDFSNDCLRVEVETQNGEKVTITERKELGTKYSILSGVKEVLRKYGKKAVKPLRKVFSVLEEKFQTEADPRLLSSLEVIITEEKGKEKVWIGAHFHPIRENGEGKAERRKYILTDGETVIIAELKGIPSVTETPLGEEGWKILDRAIYCALVNEPTANSINLSKYLTEEEKRYLREKGIDPSNITLSVISSTQRVKAKN